MRGKTSITIPLEYLNHKYEFKIISQSILGDIYYRFEIYLNGDDIIAVDGKRCSFITGGYHSNNYYQFCQWLSYSPNTIQLNDIMANGTDITQYAQTYITCRKIVK